MYAAEARAVDAQDLQKRSGEQVRLYFSMANESALEQVAARLAAARRVTILTGAGVSAASGVPTFRGAGGLWRTFRAEDLATAEAFRTDPRLVWEWYAWRRETIAACRPNAAHEVIARWAGPPERGHDGNPSEGGQSVRVLTQNVDDLHLRAGTRGLVRLHGSIWELSCAEGLTSPGSLKAPAHRRGVSRSVTGPARAGGAPACAGVWLDERVPLPDLPPRCESCGGLARPAVVWFGESLAPEDVDAAMQACQCDVFMTIGTSAIVYPAAGLVHEARRRGAFTVEINAESTSASGAVDVAIQGPAEEILPRLDEHVSGP